MSKELIRLAGCLWGRPGCPFYFISDGGKHCSYFCLIQVVFARSCSISSLRAATPAEIAASVLWRSS